LRETGDGAPVIGLKVDCTLEGLLGRVHDVDRKQIEERHPDCRFFEASHHPS
jgi:hypothetical protein